MFFSLSLRDKEFVEPMEMISEEEAPEDDHDYGDELDYGGSSGRRAVIERVASRLPGFSRLLSVSSTRSSVTGSRRHSIRRNSSSITDAKEHADEASVTEPPKTDAKVVTPNDRHGEVKWRQRERYDSTATIDSDTADLKHTLTPRHFVTDHRERVSIDVVSVICVFIPACVNLLPGRCLSDFYSDNCNDAIS